MLRAVLRRKLRDAISGYVGEQVYTLDFEEDRLESELKRGGFGESGYEAVEVVGIEYIRDLPDPVFERPWCPVCMEPVDMPHGEMHAVLNCKCGCRFEAEFKNITQCNQLEMRE